MAGCLPRLMSVSVCVCACVCVNFVTLQGIPSASVAVLCVLSVCTCLHCCCPIVLAIVLWEFWSIHCGTLASCIPSQYLLCLRDRSSTFGSVSNRMWDSLGFPTPSSSSFPSQILLSHFCIITIPRTSGSLPNYLRNCDSG